LKESYGVPNHVNKIFRSLPARFRPKVTDIQEAKDLDKLSLENLIISFKSHEIELNGDEPIQKSKSIALTSKVKSAKVSQSAGIKEENLDEGSDNNIEEMTYLTKRFHYLTKKIGFPNRSRGTKNYGFRNKSEDQEGYFNCKKTRHFIVERPELQKNK